MGWAILVALALICASLLVLAWARTIKSASGLPIGEIIAQDTTATERGKPLFSARFGLTGTPDYVVRTRSGIVPVEVKPERNDSEPYDSHLLQVLAYCLLLEESEGKRPPYGLLRYRANTFKVDYNDETRGYLLNMVDEVRQAAEEPDVHRSHDRPQRCRACGYRSICEESLWVDR